MVWKPWFRQHNLKKRCICYHFRTFVQSKSLRLKRTYTNSLILFSRLNKVPTTVKNENCYPHPFPCNLRRCVVQKKCICYMDMFCLRHGKFSVFFIERSLEHFPVGFFEGESTKKALSLTYLNTFFVHRESLFPHELSTDLIKVSFVWVCLEMTGAYNHGVPCHVAPST